jgi:CMP-N,N'-diacetyllegionaminic acid synthase
MKVLAVIPARGGSKGIPRKNIHPLAGRPLIAYSIDAARQAASVDRIVLSTDNAEIAALARSLGAEVSMRPSELAQDDTPTRAVIEHVANVLAAEGYRPDAVLTLQPTSPLRTARHIDEAVALFAANPKADSLVSCIEVPHVFNPLSVMRQNAEGYLEPFLSQQQPHRRQDKGTVLARNGAAIYLTRTARIKDFIFGGRLIPYLMDRESSIDIDTLDDLAEAERALQARACRSSAR